MGDLPTEPRPPSPEPLRSGRRRHSVSAEVMRERLALWFKLRPSGQLVVLDRRQPLPGLAGDSRCRFWENCPPPPDLMAQGLAARGPAVGNVVVIRGRGLGEGNWAWDRDEMLVGTPPTLLGNWAVLPELPG